MDMCFELGCLLRCAGPVDRTVLILVGGFAENGGMFEPLFSHPVGRRFRLIAIDLPGFGGSPRQADITSLEDHGQLVAQVALRMSRGPVGLVGHSVGSIVVTHACVALGDHARGLVALEGNLVGADAYYSGVAATFSDPFSFHRFFTDLLVTRGQSDSMLALYGEAVKLCDPMAMWHLGRDAHRAGDTPGSLLLCLAQEKLFLYCPTNLPPPALAWLEQNPELPRHILENSSHWPTRDQPQEVSRVLIEFFDRLL